MVTRGLPRILKSPMLRQKHCQPRSSCTPRGHDRNCRSRRSRPPGSAERRATSRSRTGSYIAVAVSGTDNCAWYGVTLARNSNSCCSQADGPTSADVEDAGMMMGITSPRDPRDARRGSSDQLSGQLRRARMDGSSGEAHREWEPGRAARRWVHRRPKKIQD